MKPKKGRLFSLRPKDRGFFDKPKWISQKFELILWCEHSHLPLLVFDKPGNNRGVYELDFPREWVVKAAPYLKALTVALSLVLPVASSATKLIVDDTLYAKIEDQLKFGKDCFDSVLKGGEKVGEWLGKDESLDLPQGSLTRADGATLRELHAFLKEKDPSFGGLVRVQNKQREFLWVHERFAGEY
jgi:internalin A